VAAEAALVLGQRLVRLRGAGKRNGCDGSRAIRNDFIDPPQFGNPLNADLEAGFCDPARSPGTRRITPRAAGR